MRLRNTKAVNSTMLATTSVKKYLRIYSFESTLPLMLLAVITIMFAPPAHAKTDVPAIASTLVNDTIIMALNTYMNKLVYVQATDEGPSLNIVYINTSNPIPSLTILDETELATLPSLLTIDNLYDPRYIILGDLHGNVIIKDLHLNRTLEFGVIGSVKNAVFLDRVGVAIRTSANALYVIRPSELGWFEARVLIGNLLPEKLEHVEITDLKPILKLEGNRIEYLGEGLIALRVAKLAYNTLVKAALIWSNGTPIANATVYGYIDSIGAFTPTTTTDSNGEFTLRIPSDTFYMTLFIKTNNMCYSTHVTLRDIKSGAINIVTKPIVIDPQNRAVCPPPTFETKLLILKNKYPPTLTVLRESSRLGDAKILTAYMLNNILYIWVTGRNIPLSNVTAPVFAVLAFNAATGDPIESIKGYYVSSSIATTAAIAPSGELLVIGTSDGSIYILGKNNNTYTLLWSQKLAGSIMHVTLSNRIDGLGYIIAATDTMSNLMLLAVNPDNNMVRIITRGPKGEPYIDSGMDISYLYLSPSAEYLLIAGSRGIIVLNNFQATITEGLKSLDDYMLKRVPLHIYNEDGEPVKGFTVLATLLYENNSIYKTMIETNDSKAYIPCISSSKILISVYPKNNIYLPITLAYDANKVCTANEISITVPYKLMKVKLFIVDKYTGSPPLHNIDVTIYDVKRNHTLNYMYNAGQEAPLLIKLKPGIYDIIASDIDKTFYKLFRKRFGIFNDTTLIIDLQRVPVTVEITITADLLAYPLDRLKVYVVSHDDRPIYTEVTKAPTPTNATKVVFTTAYRGPARIIIKDIPPKGLPPFFIDTSININITNLVNKANINLVPMKYPVTVTVIDNFTKSKVPAKLVVNRVYDNRSLDPHLELESNNGTLTLDLPRGVYRVYVEPLPINGSLPLNAPRIISINVNGSMNIVIELERIRVLTPLVIIDPMSPGEVVIDNIIVSVDGHNITKVLSGHSEPIKVPLLINGSEIEFISENRIYAQYKGKIKPTLNDTIVKIKLSRINHVLTITVLNDIGEPIPGVRAWATGLDLEYSTDSVGTPEGIVKLALPFGSYDLCLSAAGYNGKCITVTLATDASLVVTLTPKPITIIARYSTLITTVIVGIVILAVLRFYFKKIVERLSTEEEF